MAILRRFKGMQMALSVLFPEISFDQSCFHQRMWKEESEGRGSGGGRGGGRERGEREEGGKSNKYSAVWHDIANRRHFFEKYAKANGFDPLIPENWYEQSKLKIMYSKVAISLLLFFSSLLFSALLCSLFVCFLSCF